MADEKSQIKEWRKRMDKLMQDAQEMADFWGKSRAYSLMFTHAELAKMYGGKRLEELDPGDYPKELADHASN